MNVKRVLALILAICIAVCALPTIGVAISPQAEATYQAIEALHDITYKSKFDIEQARGLYEALTPSQKAEITNLAKLVSAETDYAGIISDYESYIDGFSGTIANDRMNKTPWMRNDNLSAAQRSAILAAFKAEAVHQYSDNAYNIGLNTETSIYGFSDALYIQCHAAPNDNITNPWNDPSRMMTFLIAPFPGMVFATRFRMATSDRGFPGLSNQFEYNGRIYQQFWDYQRSYDASVVIVDVNTPCDFKGEEKYPGKGADEKLVNAFRYTYAAYNSAAKIDGDNNILGLIDADVSITGAIQYQKFETLNGAPVFMIINSDKADNITLDIAQSGYLNQIIANKSDIITGQLAAALAAPGQLGKLEDAGKITAMSASSVTFENGTLTSSGLILSNVADYSTVYEAIDTAAKLNRNDYTAGSWNALQLVIGSVIKGKPIGEQATVNAYAAAINAAIKALRRVVSSELQLSFGISDTKTAASSGSEEQFDSVWQATVFVGESVETEAYEAFNASDINIKEYGIFYGVNEAAVLRWREIDTDPALAKKLKKSVFGTALEGQKEIDMYTTFSFRLRNCPLDAERAAAFYAVYEFDGELYTTVSPVDTVNPQYNELQDNATALMGTVESLFWKDRNIMKLREKISTNLTAYAWNYGAYIEAVAAQFASDPTNTEYRAAYKDAVDGMEYYKSSAGITFSYASGYGGVGGIFYDDNMWFIMSFYKAHELLGDATYLDKAEQLAAYCYTGWDDVLGGGIYWSEDKGEKNTCSNAPMAIVSAELYRITGNHMYLDWAIRIYDWTKATFEDPRDHLYWDNIKISTGKLATGKFSYNVGCMISAGVLLYELTDNVDYLNDARASAAAADGYYFAVVDGVLQTVGEGHWDPWIESWMIEGFLRLYEHDRVASSYIDHSVTVVTNGYNQRDLATGLVHANWTTSGASDELRDQCGTARVMFDLARWQRAN